VRCPKCGFSAGEEHFRSGCPECGYSAPGINSKNTDKKRFLNRESAAPLPFWIYLVAAAVFSGILAFLFFYLK